MHLATLSKKNQITIPVSLLSSLDIRAGVKLIVKRKGDAVVLEPLSSTIVARTAGCLADAIPRSKKGLPFLRILKETKRIVAKKLVENK